MDNSAIQQEARRILADPDFQHGKSQLPGFDVWKWLRDFLNFKSPFDGHDVSIPWQLLGLGLKAILLGLVVVALVQVARWLIQKFARRESGDSTYFITPQQRQAAQDMYARQAQDALDAGDFRLAIHCLFLAAVSQVIQDSLFHGSEYMTNREIASASDFSRFTDAGRLSRLFHDMVFFDEPLWFGQGMVSEKDYLTFRQFYSQFAASVQGVGMRGRHA